MDLLGHGGAPVFRLADLPYCSIPVQSICKYKVVCVTSRRSSFRSRARQSDSECEGPSNSLLNRHISLTDTVARRAPQRIGQLRYEEVRSSAYRIIAEAEHVLLD